MAGGMNIGLVTKLWRRPLLSAAHLRYWSDMFAGQEEFTIKAVAVASPDDPEPIEADRAAGFRIIAAPNNPLSDKTNAGFREIARGYFKAHSVINLGSDNFACETYVARALNEITRGADIVLPGALYFYDLATGRGLYYERPALVGAAAVFSGRYLESIRYRPYAAGGSRPDSDLLAVAGKAGARVVRCHAGAVLDVKTDTNIATFDRLSKNRMVAMDGPDVLRRFPMRLWDLLEEVALKMNSA